MTPSFGIMTTPMQVGYDEILRVWQEADTVLPADVLDEIDTIVAPGADLAPDEKFDTPPALLDPSLRRRR